MLTLAVTAAAIKHGGEAGCQVSIHDRSLAKSYHYPPLASPKNSENIGNKKLTLVSPIFEPTHYLSKSY